MATVGQLGTGANAGMEWGDTTDAMGGKIQGWVKSGVTLGASGITDKQTGCGNHSGGGYIGEGMGAGGACLPAGSSPTGAGGSFKTGGADPGGSSGPGDFGSGGGYGGVTEGLDRATGAKSGPNFSGVMGAGYNGDTGPTVGMGPAGGDPLDINPPEAPSMEIGPDRAGVGNTQNLSGPQPMRQGLGSRIYPALNALLKHPAY